MVLKDIISISGYTGLFRFISQGKNGIIVESLIDKKRMHASSTSRVSALDEISIYTETGEVSLTETLKSIYKYYEGKGAISHKSEVGEIKLLFENVLPGYDRDKVYVSDMKKVINWYNILLDQGIINQESVDQDDNKGDKEEDKKGDKEGDSQEDTEGGNPKDKKVDNQGDKEA